MSEVSVNFRRARARVFTRQRDNESHTHTHTEVGSVSRVTRAAPREAPNGAFHSDALQRLRSVRASRGPANCQLSQWAARPSTAQASYRAIGTRLLRARNCTARNNSSNNQSNASVGSRWKQVFSGRSRLSRFATNCLPTKRKLTRARHKSIEFTMTRLTHERAI